jgi:hypothetical protein
MRNRRGQTLVLFSVTLLALVVMVGITLTIGMRVREKVELQTLADAAAYSNAIVTARAHNQIAMWNRAQVAHMMTLAGVQSQISYSSWYVSMLGASEQSGWRIMGVAAGICAAAAFGCGPCANCCPTVKVAMSFARAFGREYRQQQRNFRRIDKGMADMARAIQGFARMYGRAGEFLYTMHQVDQLRGGLSEKVLELGTARSTNKHEYGLIQGGKLVSAREVRQASAESGQVPALGMMNGTRKDAFLRNRSGATPPYPTVLAAQNRSLAVFRPEGTGHIGGGRHRPLESGDNQAWGEDDGGGLVVVNVPSLCPLPGFPSASSFVKSSAKEYPSDHQSSPAIGHQGSRDTVHDLGSCVDSRGRRCNSVWIARQEFNIDPNDAQREKPGDQGAGAEAGAAEQWRQPVSMVGMKRDYSARSRRDPWEFNFDISVSRGSTTQVDLKKDSFGGAADEQRVLATAITYYHRHMQSAPQSWVEPPNFFNPYWRATLVPADIDGNQNMVLGGAVMGRAMKAAGFKGIQ